MQANDINQVFHELAIRLNQPVARVKKNFRLLYFVYDIDFANATFQLNAGGTQTNSFLVQNDSAFVLCEQTGVVTDVNNAFVNDISDNPKSAPFLIQLTDSGSGRNLSNTPIHFDNWFGQAWRPFRLPKPYLFDPNSQVSAQVQNLNTTTAFFVRLAFHGYKVFGDIEQFKQHTHGH